MARTKHGFFYVKTIDGGPPAMGQCYVKGATAYYEGQVMRCSMTSGSARRVAASGTSVLGVLGANVAASGATTTEVPFYYLNDRNIFEGRMLATGAPRTRLFDKVTVSVGTIHNYRVAATAYYGETTGCLRIVGWNPDDGAGTAANKRYWVTGLAATSLLGNGATDH